MNGWVWFSLLLVFILAYSEKLIKDEDNDEGSEDDD